MNRQKCYLAYHKFATGRILASQDNAGRFCLSSNAPSAYINARLQEAVLTLAQTGKKDCRDRIQRGVDFWASLQHKDGSFPEYAKYDHSFSATAFSVIAIIEAIRLARLENKWLSNLKLAGDWLCKNNETILINQEAAAAVALLKLYDLSMEKKYLDGAEKKLAIVLANQSPQGFYYEKKGFDLGYSTLTLEMLGHYYLMHPEKRILDSAGRFLRLFVNLPAIIKNVRGTNWIIIDGFEIFADKTAMGMSALKKALENYNFKHLENESNHYTDAYRLYWAYEHASVSSEKIEINACISANNAKLMQAPNFLRLFGLHRLRRWVYALKPRQSL